MNMNNTCDKNRLLKDISIVDFILVDLTEYLDTHPDDTVAISYFNHYSKIKIKKCIEFAQNFYPLTTEYAESGKVFRWVDSPMCYEGGC